MKFGSIIRLFLFSAAIGLFPSCFQLAHGLSIAFNPPCESLSKEFNIYFAEHESEFGGVHPILYFRDIFRSSARCRITEISFSGYAYDEGDAAYNLALSRQRMNSVKDEVIEFLAERNELPERARLQAFGRRGDAQIEKTEHFPHDLRKVVVNVSVVVRDPCFRRDERIDCIL